MLLGEHIGVLLTVSDTVLLEDPEHQLPFEQVHQFIFA